MIRRPIFAMLNYVAGLIVGAAIAAGYPWAALTGAFAFIAIGLTSEIIYPSEKRT